MDVNTGFIFSCHSAPVQTQATQSQFCSAQHNIHLDANPIICISRGRSRRGTHTLTLTGPVRRGPLISLWAWMLDLGLTALVCVTASFTACLSVLTFFSPLRFSFLAFSFFVYFKLSIQNNDVSFISARRPGNAIAPCDQATEEIN